MELQEEQEELEVRTKAAGEDAVRYHCSAPHHLSRRGSA